MIITLPLHGIPVLGQAVGRQGGKLRSGLTCNHFVMIVTIQMVYTMIFLRPENDPLCSSSSPALGSRFISWCFSPFQDQELFGSTWLA